jgi:phosphomannomutase
MPTSRNMPTGELRMRAERWIADDPDPATREELRGLLAQPDLAKTDLGDRFAGALQFGTAGLRGVIGAGPNRMNRAVVARATCALAQELIASVPQASTRGVVVGGDARRMSREFSEDVAAILAAAGLHVVLFGGPVPTPLVGFAVKKLRAAAGVMITASHNPPNTMATRCTGKMRRRSLRPSTLASRRPSIARRRPARCHVPR